MNLLDIIIISTMIFLVVRGVIRGFIREVASLLGIILGIWLGIRFLPQMTVFLKDYLPATEYLQVIGFGVIFLLTFLICSLSGWAIKFLFKKGHLGWLDRTLGAALAVLKGVVIAYLVIWLLILFVPVSAPLIAKSSLVPVIRKSYQSIVGAVSSEHYLKLKDKFMEKGKASKPPLEKDRPKQDGF